MAATAWHDFPELADFADLLQPRNECRESGTGVVAGALVPERMISYMRAMQRRFAIVTTTTPSDPRGFFGARIFN